MFVLYVFVLYITFIFKHAQFDLEVYAPWKESILPQSDHNWMAVFLVQNHTFYSNQDNTKIVPTIYKNHKKSFQAQILFQHSNNETMNHICHNKSSPLSQ